MSVCSVDGCARGTVARGWCSKHYQRYRATGDPTTTRFVTPEMGLEDRLSHHGWLVSDKGCWEWQGYLTVHGYGALRDGSGKMRLAHRIAYEAWVGPLPTDLSGTDYRGVVIRHTCDNRKCINPNHLLPGTNQDNMDDMVSRGGSKRGSDNPKAKLTWEQVRAIRESRGSKHDLAEIFGVTPWTIWDIRSGRTWKEG